MEALGLMIKGKYCKKLKMGKVFYQEYQDIQAETQGSFSGRTSIAGTGT